MDNLERYQAISRQRWFTSWKYSTGTNIFKGNSAAAASGIALILTVYLYAQGEVTIGNIALFITYITGTSETIWTLSMELDSFIRNYGNLKNALRRLLTNTHERTTGARLSTTSLTVQFDKLAFAYPDQPKQNVLKDLSFSVGTGEHIGIVGHSGAGKSTIIGLLLGLYEPTAGMLLFNDDDISGLSLQSVRAHCAYVPQDTNLLNRSARENITYGPRHRCRNWHARRAPGPQWNLRRSVATPKRWIFRRIKNFNTQMSNGKSDTSRVP